MAYGYIIVVSDSASDSYTYGVADTDERTIFTSYEAAKAALKEASAKFDSFLPVAYGSAFPYDNVNFDQEIEAKDFAPLGWGLVDVGEDSMRICVGLLRLLIK
jgi:hypothetical protein